MSSVTTTSEAGESMLPEPLSKTVEWVIAILLVLGGAFFALIGYVVYLAADRDLIAEWIESGDLVSGSLTDAELAAITYDVLWWTGLGLMVTGGLLVVAGIAFLAYRTSVRRRTQGDLPGSTLTNALVGGVVTVVTGFIPLSPVLGGGVSGYLQNADGWTGLRAGVLAGLVASAPVGLLLAFVVAGLVSAGYALVGAVVAAAIVFVFGYFVGLSAVGGFVGGALIERRQERAS